MTLTHRVSIAFISLLAALGITLGAAWIGYHSARADGSAVVEAVEAGSGSAVAAPAPTPTPQPSDISMIAKLYKNGAFFGAGILALFLALSIAAKVDKKRAFYYSTGLAGLALTIESIRRGDTPNATSLMVLLLPTVGLLVAGPNHVKVPPAS
jgi:hypothetical protein